MKRVQFCGSIQGSVVIRKGETEAEAIRRANYVLLDLMAKYAKNLSQLDDDTGKAIDSLGPNIGLEKYY